MKKESLIEQELVILEVMSGALLQQISKVRNIIKSESKPKTNKSALDTATIVKLRSKIYKTNFNRKVEVA